MDAISDFFEDKEPFVSALAVVVGFMAVFALSEYYVQSLGGENLQLWPRLILTALSLLLGARVVLVLTGLVFQKDKDVFVEIWVDTMFLVCLTVVLSWNSLKALVSLIRLVFSF